MSSQFLGRSACSWCEVVTLMACRPLPLRIAPSVHIPKALKVSSMKRPRRHHYRQSQKTRRRYLIFLNGSSGRYFGGHDVTQWLSLWTCRREVKDRLYGWPNVIKEPIAMGVGRERNGRLDEDKRTQLNNAKSKCDPRPPWTLTQSRKNQSRTRMIRSRNSVLFLRK